MNNKLITFFLFFLSFSSALFAQRDLTVSLTSVRQAPATFNNSGDFYASIEYVANHKTTATLPANFSLSIGMFLSTDSIVSTDDLLVQNLGSGSVGDQLSRALSFVATDNAFNIVGNTSILGNNPNGRFYFYLKTDYDGLVAETNENNNISNLLPLSIYALTCQSRGTTPWNNWIQNVRIGTLNNASDKGSDLGFFNAGYSNFYNQTPTTLNKGQAYPLSITPGVGYIGQQNGGLFFHVWIDYNGDGTFDANELALEKTSANIAISQSITIPTTAKSGLTAMRVSMKAAAYATACEQFEVGEVEEYLINIVGTNAAPDLAVTNNQKLIVTAVAGSNRVDPNGVLSVNVTVKNNAIVPSIPDSVYIATWAAVTGLGEGYYLSSPFSRNKVAIPAIATNQSVTIPASFTMPASLTTNPYAKSSDVVILLEPYFVTKTVADLNNLSVPINGDSVKKISYYYPILPTSTADLALTVTQINATWDSANPAINVRLRIVNNGPNAAKNISTQIHRALFRNGSAQYPAIADFTLVSGGGTLETRSTPFFNYFSYEFWGWKIAELPAGASLEATFRGTVRTEFAAPQIVSQYYKDLAINPKIVYADVVDNVKANDSLAGGLTYRFVPTVVNNGCRFQDSLQLVRLYNAAGGANWTRKWNLNTPINTWVGIFVNTNGCVATVVLPENNLVGTLPDLNLPNVTYFGVDGNKLSGTVPNLILPNVTLLFLSKNLFSGTLPNFNLPNVTEIYLSQNQLSGTLPNFINLPKITGLFLDQNQLSGAIPNLNLPTLRSLVLYKNQLSGVIPNFNLPNVVTLILDSNRLSGAIPNFNLIKLVNLSLANNQLSGTIPSFNFPDLNYLHLEKNQLSGCIPLSFKAYCGKNVDISLNPNLATQDFAAFCSANSTGACNVNTSYCPSKSNAPWEDWISQFQINTLINPSGKARNDRYVVGYSDFSDKIATVIRGSADNGIAADIGANWSGYTANRFVRAWIDFNNDNDFLDAGEQILEGTPVSTGVSGIGQVFSVPANAFLGRVRARIALKIGAYPTPCETFAKGEVEDYTVEISGGTTGGNQPDLTLTNLTIPTPSVQQGQILNFKADFKNIGTAAATGNFTVKSYLSTDNVLSANDYADGVVPTGNYAAGFSVAQVPAAMTVRNTVAAGQYYLILKIDADNTIGESNENNNVIVSTGLITVTAPTTGGGSDIALSLTSTPSVYRQYTTQNFRITATNSGTTAFSNVKIKFTRPALTSSGGTKVASIGTYQEFCPGGIECSEWTIPSLAGGATATLDAPIFILAPTGGITATAAILSSTPIDNTTANNTASVTVNSAVAPIAQPLVVYKPTQLIPIVIQKLNPTITESEIVLELESLIEKTVEFGISNAMGQTVLVQQILVERGMNKVGFDVSQLPQGLYFIQTNVGKGRNVPTKFIKM